ncbi:amino acid adenylation domain-containing protein [Paenibacillus kyungheensis]|uniref:Amino acid adenylation domain-containing protein n=1 Tax=Paenibacillus kyungheensis TaxID=1452732 RepID=A0AAX3M7Z4_9BACL|nr:non-ribosomal peptide synthetase [Paenibacillus kyungheensis]WCT58035.1 amino acid adenylation domain-containing protein [Paenibacillus kyungheensis]
MKDTISLIFEQIAAGKIERNTGVELLKQMKKDHSTVSDEMAIIGVAVKLPQISGLDQLWNHLKHGVNSIGEFPTSRRADTDRYLSYMDQWTPNTTYLPGAYLDEIDKFDYKFFRLTPREAGLMSPAQRLFLETAWETFEEAGYGGDKLSGSRTGVYIGYGSDSLFEYVRFIQDVEPSALSMSVPGNLSPIVASRISHLLDLRGPALAIDTSCSSSLVALHEACQAIRNGECDQALVGGIRINYMRLSNQINMGIQASDGRTRTFDDSSEGTGSGEGVITVLIKPVRKAISDGDHIHAIIKGSSINQDGNSLGLTAPNVRAQEEVILQAWKAAGIDPQTISYIEAHGTGTKLGDPIEIEAIRQAFLRHTSKKQFCGVGSVKSNFGHLDNAAGLLGLVKTILALKHHEIPATLHFQSANRQISFEDSPVYVVDRLTPWQTSDHPRRAGVSSFGLSGTNCHVVLEEAPALILSELENLEGYLLPLSAKTMQALRTTVEQYLTQLRENPSWSLADICYTAGTCRGHYAYRLAIHAYDLQEMQIKLDRLIKEWPSNDCTTEGVFYGEKDSTRQPEDVALVTAVFEKLNQLSESDDKTERLDMLMELGYLYTKFTDIPWDVLYQGEHRQKLSLPTYPFERTRCWISITPRQHQAKEQTISMNIALDKGSSAHRKLIFEFVMQTLEDISGIPQQEIQDEVNFFELGLDSILLFQVSEKIKDRYTLELSLSRFYDELSTPKALIDHLATHIPQESEVSTLNLQTAQAAQTPTRNDEPTQDDLPTSDLTSMQPSGQRSELKDLFSKQLDIISRQLDLLHEDQHVTTSGSHNSSSDELGRAAQTNIVLKEGTELPLTTSSELSRAFPKTGKQEAEVFMPYRKLNLSTAKNLSDKQARHTEALIGRLSERFKVTKEFTQKYRAVLANNRNVAGFRPAWKEIIFQVIAKQAQGARIWDIDDHEYIDISMGFGAYLLGHAPTFITDTIRTELEKGMAIGPMNPLAGEVADQIAKFTGSERVAFFNSGTEAVMVALRLARAVTGRSKVVLFEGAFHGTFDGVLARRHTAEPDGRSAPMAPGITDHLVGDVVVLKYGDPQALEIINRLAGELAAVLVEPVQSRRPDLQPQSFLHELRKITENHGAALIFDEVITGFRIGQGGAQEWFDVRADIATYGKVIGAGMPVGVVAGKARFLNAIDGGWWEYGDASYPTSDGNRTLVGGTFCHHPLTMASILAMLTHLRTEGPMLQKRLNERTERLVSKLNRYFSERQLPISMVHFGSLFRFVLQGDLELLFYHLLEKGIYVWEGRNCFLSTAHTDEDIDKIIHAVIESVEEMQAGGFFSEKREEKASITRAERNKYYPISSAQRRQYALQQIDPASTAYHLTSSFMLKGPMDRQMMEKALQRLANRHESLRTSFAFVEGEVVQIVHEDVRLPLVSVQSDDLLASERFSQPFDLGQAPLLRVHLREESPEKHVIEFNMHHIVTDGISMDILFRDLAALYQEQDYILPKLEIHYKDYAKWELEQFSSDAMQQHESYWLEQFTEEPPKLQLPTDYPHPAVKSFEGGSLSFVVDESLRQDLNVLARKSGATLYMVLLTAYHLFLSKYTSQQDIVIGSPATGRPGLGTENVIGMFVNTLALRIRSNGNQTFSELLRQVKASTLAAVEHQSYPLDRLIAKLPLERDTSRNPLFDTLLVFDKDMSSNFAHTIKDIEIERIRQELQTAQFDLALHAVEESQTLRFTLVYARKLFAKETAERMLKHFERIVQQVVLYPMSKLSEFDLSTEEELKQIKTIFNNTQAEYDKEATLPHLFEEQTARTPDQTAAVFSTGSWTYSELNKRANQLARTLQAKAVKPDQLVGVLLERSPEMMLGLLAILKAGGAYVPIDPTYPKERISYMLQDSGASLLLTRGKETTLDVPFEGEVLDLTDEALYANDDTDLPGGAGANDMAYVIYTSGSTGEPKGVMIEHQAVINRLQWMQKQFPLTTRDVILQKTPFSFDVSVWELFWWSLSGASVVFAEPGAEKDPEALAQSVHEHQVTVMHFVPSMLQLFLEHVEATGQDKLRSLRRVFVSGETLQASQASRFGRLLKDRWGTELINLYGPTEATVDVSYHECSCEDHVTHIPIGQPIDNMSLYILDREGRVQPVGVPGELYIGGVGLARGYWNRPELTEERFTTQKAVPGIRLYRTGDIGKWLSNGEMAYGGRIDHQVKIRGNRIELGEIETQLLRHPQIQEAVVTVHEAEAGRKELSAYYVSEGVLGIGAIQAYVGERLPAYMVPTYGRQLEAMPLTANGKLDRKRLPAPQRQAEQRRYVAPRNEVEEQLVSVWQEVLGVERIGIDEHFFHMGGDSIKAIQISAKLMSTGLVMQVKELFEKPTIRSISPLIRQQVHNRDQGSVEGAVILTPIQHWFFDKHSSDLQHFNQSLLMRAAHMLDAELVKKVIAKLVEHHDALRLVFEESEGKWISFNRGLSDKPNFEFQVHNYRDLPQVNMASQIEEEAAKYQASIHLNEGPLCKVVLFQTADKDYLLFIIHHLAVDGLSWRILLEDFQTSYAQLCQNKTIQLPDKTDSYLLWANRLQNYANMPNKMHESFEYWKGFASHPVDSLPVDRSVTGRCEARMQSKTLNFPEPFTELLLTTAHRAYHTETNDLLLAALGLTIHEWAGLEHIWIQLEGHGRESIMPEININRTVGWFTSLFPVLLSSHSPSGNLSDIIKSVKESIRGIPDKGLSYGMLRYLTDQNLPEIEPEICFNYLGQFDQRQSSDVLILSELPIGRVVSPNIECPFKIDINGIVKDGQLILTFRFDREEFLESTIQRFISTYERHLNCLVSHCVDKPDLDFTPSDFSAAGLDMEDLDDVFRAIEEKF